MEPRTFHLGSMKVQIFPNAQAAGEAAAECAAAALRDLSEQRERIGVIFATGSSQFETLRALTSIAGLPWEKVHGFHMDEYIGIGADHPASFRRYLRERLTSRVGMASFHEMDGSAADLTTVRREYMEKLNAADAQICLLASGRMGILRSTIRTKPTSRTRSR